MPTPALPVIDLAGGNPSEADKRRIATELDEAFREIGFCYIGNTGVEPSMVASVFQESARFHALDSAYKQTLAVNEFHRGYIAPASSVIRTSSVAKVTRPNQSESLMIMHDVAPDSPRFGSPLQGPNQWPQVLPGFEATVRAYQEAMTSLSRRVTRLIALALGLDEVFLDEHFAEPTTWLRLLYYPSIPPDSPADVYGSAPHTDYGFLTILAQDALGGLEVRMRDGQWVNAEPLEDTFVVNVADMLARWTNDRWVSTPHRVRNTAGQPRYSVPFFWDMSMRSEVACLPGCTTDGEQPKYPPVVFGDYVMERLNRNYRYRQGADA